MTSSPDDVINDVVTDKQLRNPWQWGRLVLLLLVGVAIGVLGAFVQDSSFTLPTRFADVTVPWGIVLVLAAYLSMVRAGAWSTRTRIGAGAVVVGWIIATFSLVFPSSTGDMLVTVNAHDAVYVIAGLVLGVVASALPVRDRDAKA